VEAFPPPGTAQVSSRLSGHVSPVQSIGSTGSGLYQSREPSPDCIRGRSPIAFSHDPALVGLSPARVAIHSLPLGSPYQDSDIRALEEEATRMPYYTNYPGSYFPTKVQVLILSNQCHQLCQIDLTTLTSVYFASYLASFCWYKYCWALFGPCVTHICLAWILWLKSAFEPGTLAYAACCRTGQVGSGHMGRPDAGGCS
jgi:hypothetical protein